MAFIMIHHSFVFYYKDPNATGTYKLLGDFLRQNPRNILYQFNQEILKEKLMSGSYATCHVLKNTFIK